MDSDYDHVFDFVGCFDVEEYLKVPVPESSVELQNKVKEACDGIARVLALPVSSGVAVMSMPLEYGGKSYKVRLSRA
jgi:hypothetical protein